MFRSYRLRIDCAIRHPEAETTSTHNHRFPKVHVVPQVPHALVLQPSEPLRYGGVGIGVVNDIQHPLRVLLRAPAKSRCGACRGVTRR